MTNRYWLLLSAIVCLDQIDYRAAEVTRPWWYCYGDICNRNGTDQYCSYTYKRCFDCADIWHRCFTEDMPLNCTKSCKDYILEQQKNVPCPVLEEIANGRQDVDKINVSYPGDVIRYSCAPGFRLEGPRELKCVGFGQWSSTPPECIRITCPVLNDVQHGKLIGSNLTFKQEPGTVFKITCSSGYRLIGSETITCSQNGEWSSALPICLEFKCSALPAVLNGEWSSELNLEFSSGGTATLHCLGDFTLLGSPVWECSDGIWVSVTAQHDRLPVCTKECPVFEYVLIGVALVVVSVIVTATGMICYQKFSMASKNDGEYQNQMKIETVPLIPHYNNHVDGTQVNQSKQNERQQNSNHVQNDTTPLIQNSDDRSIHQNNNQVSTDNDCPTETNGTDNMLQNNTELLQQSRSEKAEHQSNIQCKSRKTVINAEGANKGTEISNHASPVHTNVNVINTNKQNPLRLGSHSDLESNITPDTYENTAKKQTQNDNNNTQVANPPESTCRFPTQVSTENEKNPTYVAPDVNKAASYKQPCYVVQQGTIEQDVNRKLITGGTEMHIGDHDGTTNAENYEFPQPITVAS